MTIDVIESFDDGDENSTPWPAASPGGATHFNNFANTGQVSWPAGRTGSCVEVTGNGTTAGRFGNTLPGTPTIRVFSFYFRAVNNPVNQSQIFRTFRSGYTNVIHELRINTDGSLQVWLQGTTQNSSGDICDGNWHRVDLRLDVSATTYVVDWKIDGTTQTQVTDTGNTAGSTWAPVLGYFGGSDGNNFTAQLDDFVSSPDTADYPINGGADYWIGTLKPSSDGTHFAGTNIIEDQAGTDIGATAAWSVLDDINPIGTSTYIRQVAHPNISAANRGTPLYDTTDQSTYTMTDAGTPTATRLLIAMVYSRGGTQAPTSFTGYGLTWQDAGGANRADSDGHMHIYAALTGASPTSADPQATFASGRTGCSILVNEVTLPSYGLTALECLRDKGGGVYINSVTGTGTAPSLSQSPGLTGYNRPMSFFAHDAAEQTNQRTNWTELADGTFATPNSGIHSQYRGDSGEAACGPSWSTSSAYIGVALELAYGGHYAEVLFEDTTEATILAASMSAYGVSATTGATTGALKLYDSSGVYVWTFHDGDMSGGSVSLRSGDKVITAPGGGWTQSYLNGLRLRLGYSITANATDYPRFHDAFLHYVYAAAALNPPGNLAAVAVSPTQINLSWDNASGATSYDIEEDTVVIETGYTGSHTPGSPYQRTGRSPATEYDYRVRSRN